MDKELTMPERREFLEHMGELIRAGVLNRDDKDRIIYICLEACEREAAAIR